LEWPDIVMVCAGTCGLAVAGLTSGFQLTTLGKSFTPYATLPSSLNWCRPEGGDAVQRAM